MKWLVLLAAGGAASAQAAPLFSRNDPLVAKGNEAYDAGKYEEALKDYEEAEKVHPRASQLPFNRGNALYKLRRLDEAKEAYERALGTDDKSLKADDYYNMGNAFAGMGKDDEAVDAYRRALRIDPQHEDARHNLELAILRKRKQPPNPSPDGGVDGGSGHRDGGHDGGSGDGGGDGGAGDGGRGDGGADGGMGDGGGGDGGRGDGGGHRDGGSGDGGGQQKQQSGGDGGVGDAGATDGGSSMAERRRREEQPISRQEAEQILDSLRRNEKSFQSWKFKKLKHPPVEKDW